jgi:hypothetical protein
MAAFGAAPADAGVAGRAGVRPCLRGAHARHPLLRIPPEVTECQMAWLVRKLGRCDTPVFGRAVTAG